MAIGAILNSVLQSALAPTNVPSKFKQFQQEFQQLGQDLQAGNLAQAQADFVTLRQNSPNPLASTTASSATAGATTGGAVSAGNNPIAQAFNQLAQDLKAGNVTAAQQDFSAIQQDFQNARTQGQGGGHHHHHNFISNQNYTSGSPFGQLFSQLGQALQTGNLSSAQQAYSTLQQDFQKFAGAGGTSGGSSGISVTA
ncbi:MAG: hypothetical protein WB987_07340 [Candidatus Acidiferrales bacterium]